MCSMLRHLPPVPTGHTYVWGKQEARYDLVSCDEKLEFPTEIRTTNKAWAMTITGAHHDQDQTMSKAWTSTHGTRYQSGQERTTAAATKNRLPPCCRRG